MRPPALGVLGLPARPLLVRLGALALLLALGAGPVSSALDASAEIDAARLRLDRAREQVARPAAGLPLVAPDGEALLAAFRARLDALGPGALVDVATLDADPAKPDLPRLRASIRGTAQGLHGLMHALETGTPLVAVEEADLAVDRPADAEIGRPTILRLALTVRGVVAAPKPTPKPAPGKAP
jgi:hypothetical protein